MNRRLTRPGLGLTLLWCLGAAPEGDDPRPKPAPIADAGRSYRVPYRLTDTNHFLVRVRVNGKGPFNFLVDTGAPALYVATETAKKVGLKASDDEFWTKVDRLDFEGGATLRDVKSRVEDPFQLVGMNALGLPGASIDGILGFTMLARYKIEIDPTRDRMTWTRLDFEPQEPPVPDRRPGERPPAEMQAMNALGPLAKFAAAFIGKQPEEERLTRGFLGLALEEARGEVRVASVLPGSPAETAKVGAGDLLVRIGDRDVKSLKDARAAVAGVRPGDKVRLTLRQRGGEGTTLDTVTPTLTAGEGF